MGNNPVIRNLLIIYFLMPTVTAVAQEKISFPDAGGYKVLVCDPHIHTVFSDGLVWPTIRVEEGIREGLDVVVITDHLEYQPHHEDIPNPNRNHSFELAKASAKDRPILVISGAEVTRSMPPGHINVMYLQDVNALLKDDPFEVLREASRQGAFIYWNHPSWPGKAEDGSVHVFAMHEQLIKEGLLHGIEVINGKNYYEDAVALALKYNLAMLGSSDTHVPTEWDYQISKGEHRPSTLILAKEKTEASVKEALLDRRTIAWHNSLLAGPEKYVSLLVQAILKVRSAKYQGSESMGAASVLSLVLENNSDVEFTLENASHYSFQQSLETVVFPPRTSMTLYVKTFKKLKEVEIPFFVRNAVVDINQHPTWVVRATVN